MNVECPVQINDLQQLMQWFQPAFPQYQYSIRGKSLLVKKSTAVGLLVTPQGPSSYKLGWAIPNMGLQLMLNLSFLAGILPGIVGYLILWLATKGTTEKFHNQLSVFLSSGGQEIVQFEEAKQASAPKAARKQIPGLKVLIAACVVAVLALSGFAMTYNEYGSWGTYESLLESARRSSTSSSYGVHEQNRQRENAVRFEGKVTEHIVSTAVWGIMSFIVFMAALGLFALFFLKRVKAKSQALPA